MMAPCVFGWHLEETDCDCKIGASRELGGVLVAVSICPVSIETLDLCSCLVVKPVN